MLGGITSWSSLRLFGGIGRSRLCRAVSGHRRYSALTRCLPPYGTSHRGLAGSSAGSRCGSVRYRWTGTRKNARRVGPLARNTNRTVGACQRRLLGQGRSREHRRSAGIALRRLCLAKRTNVRRVAASRPSGQWEIRIHRLHDTYFAGSPCARVLHRSVPDYRRLPHSLGSVSARRCLGVGQARTLVFETERRQLRRVR